MPIGELVVNIVLRPIFEIVFLGLTYPTGYVLLKAVSLGRLWLAPLTTYAKRNREVRSWRDFEWTLWLDLSEGRALKAEETCLVGMVV